MKLKLRNEQHGDDAEQAPVKTPKAGKVPKAPKRPKAGKKKGDSSGAPKDAQPKAKGAARFVLLLGDDGAILIFMRGNSVQRRLFAPSPQLDHIASITELMSANPGVPLTILMDVMDQQYVRHSFPPVSSLSVGGLVKRRLDRDFQAEDLKGSLPLGRDKTGRKEWNFLLIALAYTPQLQEWLEILVELPNELKGIYLVPVETQLYIPALKKALGGEPMSWQLLVTHNKVSGFRQVVLRDGRIVFTRVSQSIDDGTAAVTAGNIEQEIINTIEYLRRLGFQENSSMEIYVIAAQEVKDALDINRFQAGIGHVLTPLDVADLLGLQQAALSADRFGDVVLASWFAKSRKHVLKLQTAYGEQLAKLYTARRAMLGVGALAVVAALGMAAMHVMGAVSTEQQATDIETRRGDLQQQVAAQQKIIDALDKNVAYKSAVVAVSDAYMKDTYNPLDFITALTPFITDNVRVTDMQWGAADGLANSNAVPPMPGTAAPITGPLQIKLTIEFLQQYKDLETLTEAVDKYVASIKTGLPRYAITVAPYAWLSSDNLEISLDKPAEAETLGGEKVKTIEMTVLGPGPEPTPAPGAAGNVPPPPGALP
jgi:hypothetical protein